MSRQLAKNFRTGLRPIFVVVIIGAVGTWALVESHAATGVASVESEKGTISSPAAAVNDTTASGGKAVKFGSGTSGSGGGSDFCSSYPALPSSKPDASNTGIPAGTTLTNSGGITVNTAGTVINGKNISGGIQVSADNVTIENSKITTTGYYGIMVSGGATGTKIIHNEVYTTNGGFTGISGNGNGETICGNYIHGWENGMTLTGGGMMVQANCIEKLQSNQSGPHYDGIELYGGNSNQFWGNNIMLTDTSGNWLGETGALNVAPFGGASVANVLADGNWFGGGSYTLTLDDGSGSVSTLNFTDNVFYGSGPTGHATYGPVREPSLITSWTGNTWSDTGQAVSP